MNIDIYAAKLRRLTDSWPAILAFQTHVPGQLLLGELHEEDVTDDGFIAVRTPAIVTETEERMIVTKLTGIRDVYFLNPRQYVGFGLAGSPYLENYLEWKRHAS
jgi:hypothetical protein